MRQLIDLTGMKFGRLTVIERAENSKNRGARWLCQCDCGKKVIVRSSDLRNGQTVSCGCWNRERSTKHGMAHTKIYEVWKTIKARCFNPNNHKYPNYGGRGITMFAKWISDFQSFYDYVSTLPHFGEEGYSLDRINNNGNYEPDNLRWADRKTQARNKCDTIYVKYKDRLVTLGEASEITGIPYITLWERLKRGITGEDLYKPVKK